MADMSHVIAAIATGAAPCAIGIVRLSGAGCLKVAEQIFTLENGKPLESLPNRTLRLGTLHDRQGRVIDRAQIVYCRAPHSYTGEDTVELQCHGSPAMLAACLEALFASGARQALPGEFTKRAFLNGRLDLTQAEAVIDLIDAQTAEGAANAAGQLGGTLSQKLVPIYDALTDLCSHFHAVLDYPDEDIEDFGREELSTTLRSCSKELQVLLDTYDRGRFLKNGVKAVLLGKPNVGKSSLLNALAGFERVIVTKIAGTTRDTVEETVKAGSVLLRLIDTAGIRETDNEIEALGVARSEAAAKDADLAIFVCDSSEPLTEEDMRAMEVAKAAPGCLAILNKTDKAPCVTAQDLPFETVIGLSAQTGENMTALQQEIERRFAGQLPCDGSILTNPRQYSAIFRAKDALLRAEAALNRGITPDAVLTDGEEAMEAMGEVIGRTVREDITGRIFERFCVGK